MNTRSLHKRRWRLAVADLDPGTGRLDDLGSSQIVSAHHEIPLSHRPHVAVTRPPTSATDGCGCSGSSGGPYNRFVLSVLSMPRRDRERPGSPGPQRPATSSRRWGQRIASLVVVPPPASQDRQKSHLLRSLRRRGGLMTRRRFERSVRARGDADLLLGAQAPAASSAMFDEFYRRHEGSICLYFSRRVVGSDVPADLTAETFTRALAHLGRFDPARGRPAGWLFGIARNVLREHQRAVRADVLVRRRFDDVPADPTALPEVERVLDRMEGSALASLLPRLPSTQRDALLCRMLTDGDGRAIADHLGCTPGNARVILHRATLTMRQLYRRVHRVPSNRTQT